MKRFLDLANIGREEILDLIALAHRLEAHPEPRALVGRILGLVFFNPSLRTLSSFQVGMARLGGTQFDPVMLQHFLRIDLAEYDAMNASHGAGLTDPWRKAA